MTAVPVTPVSVVPLIDPLSAPAAMTAAPKPAGSFSQMLIDAADAVTTKVDNADKMVRAFALDDSIPVHQVTYALTQAQMSLEMAMQVRSRLLESYQQLMNMQL